VWSTRDNVAAVPKPTVKTESSSVRERSIDMNMYRFIAETFVSVPFWFWWNLRMQGTIVTSGSFDSFYSRLGAFNRELRRLMLESLPRDLFLFSISGYLRYFGLISASSAEFLPAPWILFLAGQPFLALIVRDSLGDLDWDIAAAREAFDSISARDSVVDWSLELSFFPLDRTLTWRTHVSPVHDLCTGEGGGGGGWREDRTLMDLHRCRVCSRKEKAAAAARKDSRKVFKYAGSLQDKPR